MSESLFSTSWYRIAELKPQLRTHAEIHRHYFRGERWYVLQDHASGRSHRFSPAAYQVIGLMNGRRSMQTIWENVTGQLGDDAPTQDEILQLLGQLHAVDLLQSDIPPDVAELGTRSEKIRRQGLKQRLMNPMALRFPLFDPERLLERGLPWVGPLFSTAGAVLWLLVVATAVILMGMHWSALTENVADRVLAPHNLLILGLTFPAIKALHELGHGFAVKRWGGEVHEMGIMLLVLMPVPYVDANAAWGFREQRKRVIVGAAGMLIEVFLASLALFLWLALEPGLLRAIAFDVMVIAGVSTLLFNANPLLRFDGYFILQDVVEIPNLGTRAIKYLGYLCQRYLFGLASAVSPANSAAERRWFVFYGIASFAYRIFIASIIIVFIAGKFFVVGMLLAFWAATLMLVLPVLKGVRFVLADRGVRRRRARAVAMSTALGAGLLALVFVVPVPFLTVTEGVLAIEDESYVRAGSDGFVRSLLAEPGAMVKPGQPLVGCTDPELTAGRKVLEAEREEVVARYQALRSSDYVEAEIVLEEKKTIETELALIRERSEALVVRSRRSGVFVVPRASDLPGRFLKQGELIGFVLEGRDARVRTVVGQSEVDLVRQRTDRVSVRLAERPEAEISARIERVVPAATHRLPSAALSKRGGGQIANDPGEQREDVAFQALFTVDLYLPEWLEPERFGGRVFVRFNHGYEALASQWWRTLRQVFLRLLND